MEKGFYTLSLICFYSYLIITFVLPRTSAIHEFDWILFYELIGYVAAIMLLEYTMVTILSHLPHSRHIHDLLNRTQHLSPYF